MILFSFKITSCITFRDLPFFMINPLKKAHTYEQAINNQAKIFHLKLYIFLSLHFRAKSFINKLLQVKLFHLIIYEFILQVLFLNYKCLFVTNTKGNSSI